ncbi:MAG: hypothetical protein QG585_184 [Patescibacteria group bacterium]|jgi:hypothetical protein|nr:hypothetical protein [Patescibacteria group bacterium]
MKTKNILIIITLLIILGASTFWYKSKNETIVLNQEEGTEKFSGVLKEVNTGCFADGECYVVVDQKHITLLIGWSQDTVGSIIGAPSIGDLEGFKGKEVEVYAQKKNDGTYTLYGNEDFYVKIK